MDKGKYSRAGRFVWPVILTLFFVGIFALPMNLRHALFETTTDPGRIGWINFVMVTALILMIMLKRDYKPLEIVLSVLWLLLLIPMYISNMQTDFGTANMLASVFNTWLPLFMLYQRLGPEYRKKLIHIFLIVYDVIIIIFLCLAIHEKLTSGGYFAQLMAWYEQNGLNGKDFKLYQRFMTGSPFRYCSLWGHALTNCAFFNSFFILNDIYYRSVRRRYPKLIFFLIALAGVLLCVGKMAIITLLAYLVISNWKHKKWFFVYAAAAAAMYFAGFFSAIISRFSNNSLSSGRLEALQLYFSTDMYPFKLWTGYGAGVAYLKEMASRRPAFEFPPLMYALNYGIVFSVIMIGTIFVYFTWHCLSRKQVASWLGITLYFAQVNTYNGIALCSQDMFWFLMIFMLIAINCVQMRDYLPDEEPAPVHGFRGVIIHILCCE